MEYYLISSKSNDFDRSRKAVYYGDINKINKYIYMNMKRYQRHIRRCSMEDKDIKILEEFISNYKDIQEKYKDDEIQAEIERSCYFEEVPAIQIEKLLRAYKNIKIQLQEQKNINKKLSLEAQKYFDALMEDERVINEMSGYIIGYPIVLDDDAITLKTEEEVMDYFRNKVNNKFDVEEFIDNKINKRIQEGGNIFPID